MINKLLFKTIDDRIFILKKFQTTCMKKIIITISLFLLTISVFTQNVGIGTTAPQSRLSVGVNSEFQINSIGNIVKVNNVPLIFPSNQALPSEYLKNDGAGNLIWKKPIPSGSIILSEFNNPSLEAEGFTLTGKFWGNPQQNYVGVRNGAWANTSISGTPSLISASNSVYTGFEYATYENGKVYLYDLGSSTWLTSTVANIPGFINNRSDTRIATDGDNIYVFGGLAVGSIPLTTLKTCIKYGILTGLWTVLPDIPSFLTEASICISSNEIYLSGGYVSISSNPAIVNNKVYKYNIVSNTWFTYPQILQPFNFRQGVTLVYNNILYRLGGIETSNDFRNQYLIATNLSTFTNTYAFVIGPTFGGASLTIDANNEIWGTIAIDLGIAAGDNIFFKYSPLTNLVEYYPNTNSLSGLFTSATYWVSNKFYHYDFYRKRVIVFDPSSTSTQQVFGTVSNFQYYIYRKN